MTMIFSTVLTVASSFLVCAYLIPTLLKIANRYQIYDKVNEIKRHNKNVSFFGGIALVSAFLLSTGLFLSPSIVKPVYITEYRMILMIIFIHGLGDDFFDYPAINKFIFQGILISSLIFFTGLYIPFEALFSATTIPVYLSLVVTIMGAIGIVNAINLIDGSDGLAGTLSMAACLTFSALFYLDGNLFYAILALTVSASLLAFLFYNKPPARIFLGDSGSLFIGLLLSTFTMEFIASPKGTLNWGESKRLIIVFSTISIPVLDMVRLIIHRLYNGKNPLKGDNNHIHHIMSEIGFTKSQIVAIIFFVQLFITGMGFIAFESSWIGYILITASTYIIFIQAMRQLRTYLSFANKKINTHDLFPRDNAITKHEVKIIHLEGDVAKRAQ